jgi:hypothetical protein
MVPADKAELITPVPTVPEQVAATAGGVPAVLSFPTTGAMEVLIVRIPAAVRAASEIM